MLDSTFKEQSKALDVQIKDLQSKLNMQNIANENAFAAMREESDEFAHKLNKEIAKLATKETPPSVLEMAAYAGNLDEVKQIVAMHEDYPVISGKTLLKLIDPFLFPGVRLQNNNHTKIALYLMDNCYWSLFDIEAAYKEAGLAADTSFFEWISAQKNHEFHGFPHIEYYIRFKSIEEELNLAVKANDVTSFSRKLAHYTRDDSYLAEGLDYILPEFLNSRLRRTLRKHNLPQTSEYLSMQASNEVDYLLVYLMPKVNKKNVAMLAKFLTSGVMIESFEMHVGMTVKEWCQQNYCLDLLEDKVVIASLDKQQKRKTFSDLVKKSNNTKLTEHDKTSLMNIIDAQGIDFLKNSFIMCSDAKPNQAFYQWAVNSDLSDILAIEDVLPSANAHVYHYLVLAAAENNASNSLDFLIAYANLECPEALRFSKDEINELRSQGHSQSAETLSTAYHPTKRPSLLWQGLSYFANAALSHATQVEGYSYNDDQPSLFTAGLSS